MQTKIKYRIEFNRGSKYFKNAFEAFWYYENCKSRREYDTELWICIIEVCNGKELVVRQELLDYFVTLLSSKKFKELKAELIADHKRLSYHGEYVAGYEIV